jgi:hypothetical protein
MAMIFKTMIFNTMIFTIDLVARRSSEQAVRRTWQRTPSTIDTLLTMNLIGKESAGL